MALGDITYNRDMYFITPQTGKGASLRRLKATKGVVRRAREMVRQTKKKSIRPIAKRTVKRLKKVAKKPKRKTSKAVTKKKPKKKPAAKSKRLTHHGFPGQPSSSREQFGAFL